MTGHWRDGSQNNFNQLIDLNNENIVEGCTKDAKKIREEFTNYFVEEGELEWQYKNI